MSRPVVIASPQLANSNILNLDHSLAASFSRHASAVPFTGSRLAWRDFIAAFAFFFVAVVKLRVGWKEGRC